MQRRQSTHYGYKRFMTLNERRGANVVEVFTDRLSNFCNDLRLLLAEDFDPTEEILMVNASKEAVDLANMYETSDVFIDEVSGKDGFTAETDFDSNELNILDIDFPSALRMISDCIKDMLDGDCDSNEISTVQNYFTLISKFLMQLRKDYSI